MATFASVLAAEQRAREKVADGTWTNAFAGRAANGTPAVTAQRKVTATGGGEWAEITDDATT